MRGPVPRPGLLDIAPYVGGESALAGVEKVIKLSSNEGAFGASPKAVAAYHQAAETIHRYPDGHAIRLREALGAHYGLDPLRILCGNGSDDLLQLLCIAFAGPGDEVLYSRHGFLAYPIFARSVGATPVPVPERDLTADVDAFLARVNERTRIVFLANPNNPTGTCLPAPAVARLHAGLPETCLLVIDAAYADFVAAADYDPGIALAQGAANVVMTRTFSKIYGMGAMRLGWGFMPREMVEVLDRIRNPFNTSGPAQAAGIAALEDGDFHRRVRSHTLEWRAWTAARLTAIGLQVTPSEGNFLLVHFPPVAGRDAPSADSWLRIRGILVRRVASYGLPDCLRITIGREEEMRALVGALAEFQGRNG